MSTKPRLALTACAALATLAVPASASASAPASAGSEAPPASIAGNVDVDAVGEYDSVGYIFDGEFHFFVHPDAGWTRVIGVDETGQQALVWWRVGDDTGYSGSALDLTTNAFSSIAIDDIEDFFVRGLTDDGRIVGGAYRPPDDTTEPDAADIIFGFTHNPATGETVTIERDGTSFTGVSDAIGDVLLGYTDGGLATFIWHDGEFVDIDGDGANRLLGSAINADGVVVGFASWDDDPLWAPLPRGFVAHPTDDGYLATPFELDGMARTSINGVNDAGTIAGHVNEYPDDPMVPYTADLDDPTGSLTLHPLPEPIGELFTTPGTGANVAGIDNAGRIYGTVFITDPEPELWEDEPVCSGHGHLHGDECHCDDGFQPDPDDHAACIPDEPATDDSVTS